MNLTKHAVPVARDIRWREQVTHVLLMGVLCFAGEKLAQLAWSLNGDIPAWCVAPPLLMAWLLLQPGRTWIASALGAALGTWWSWHGAEDLDTWASVALAAGLPLPPLAVARSVRRHGLATWPPETLQRGGLFLLAVGGILPLLDVGWLSLWHRVADAAFAPRGVAGLLFTQIAGYLLLVPIALSLPRLPSSRSRRRIGRDLCIAVVLAIPPLLLWSRNGPPTLPSALMTAAAAPVLFWTLLRFGLGGACLALLACGTAGIVFSARGAGPFSGLPVATAILSMQAWLCVAASVMWLLGAALDRQRVIASQLRDAYCQLSGLTGRILVVQEEERTRIARDLHDDINQSLAALSIRLSYLKRGVDEAHREAVAELQQDLLRVSNDIRNISHSLHPAMLRFTGLDSALAGFCQNQAQRSTLHIHCDVDPPEGLDDARELDLFRIVQEALNNVEKHARAHEAWVSLRCAQGSCLLLVCDDGIGPPAQRHRATAGLGMISMSERARLLGGQLSLKPREGGGTRLEVRFPCPAAAHGSSRNTGQKPADPL